MQHFIVANHIRRCQVSAVICLKQHFFLVVDCCRRKYFFAGQVAEIRLYSSHAFKNGFGNAYFVPCMHLPEQFNFLVFQLHFYRLSGAISPLCIRYSVRKAPHIAVKQGCSAINALSGGLVLNGDNITVAVGLNARVNQAPFQNRVVIIVDVVRLQVCPNICIA